jgi:hypothetical protein
MSEMLSLSGRKGDGAGEVKPFLRPRGLGAARTGVPDREGCGVFGEIYETRIRLKSVVCSDGVDRELSEGASRAADCQEVTSVRLPASVVVLERQRRKMYSRLPAKLRTIDVNNRGHQPI